jgi:hypothetical protein
MGARAERLWPGSTIACLATGPSLTQSDCDRVRAAGCRVIAINDAHRLAPWADVLYSSDRRWWSHYRGVPEFPGLKFGVGGGLRKNNGFHRYPEIRVLRNSGYSGLELSSDGLRTGRNSGHAAINLAVHLGAARIILLGYNLSYRNGQAHFFGNHPPGLPQSSSLYPGFRRTFSTLVEPLTQLGIEVFNCTEETSLTCFSRVRLSDVLRKVAA